MIAALKQTRFSPSRHHLREAAALSGCVAGLGVLWLFLMGSQLNLLCAVMLGSALILVLARSQISAILLTLGYLHVLGDFRRLVDVVIGVPELDLLLLVGPVMTTLLALPIFLRLKIRDSLSKAMLVLTVLMVLEIFNPAQGGLAVGISGALFYLVPVLWFWIGREFASPVVIRRLLYQVVLPLGILAALLGLWQTLVGFFPYEQSWIDATLKNYTALSLGGTTRAFGFSVSAAEYATLLELSAASVAAAFLAKRRVWVLAFPLLLSAMLLASGRTVVVKLILALAVIWTLRRREPLNSIVALKLGGIVVAGLVGISVLATAWAPAGGAAKNSSATQESIAHLSGGLAHPFDQRYSTVGIHQGMFLAAIGSSLASPLGHGLGSTTGAATKFTGSSEVYSSEIDVSDMFVLMGPVGGLTYLYILCAALRMAVRYTQQTHLSVGLPVLAILVSTIGAWLISGQYSTSALVFFLIGATTYSRKTPPTVLEAEQTSDQAIPLDQLSVAA